VNALQAQIKRLEQDLDKWKDETKRRRVDYRTLREETEGLKAQLAQVAAERDEYKTAFESEPHELQAQVDEYRGKLRDRDHRDKFRELGKAAGVTESKALDDLYQLSGYKPEKDEIDEKTIQAAIDATLQGRDWLKSPVAAAGSANGKPAGAGTVPGQGSGQPAPPLQPGPGASRGGASVRDDTDAVLESKYPNAFRLA
jgi:hypothetical protein